MRARLMAIVVLGAVLTVGVAAAGFIGLERTNAAKESADDFAEAKLALSRAGEQRHAVQTVVFQAVLGVNDPDVPLASPLDGFAEAVNSHRADFAALTRQGVPDDLQHAMLQHSLKLQAYITQGEELLALTASDPQLALARLATFDAASAQIEAAQDDLVEGLDEVSVQAAAAGARATHDTRVEMLIIGVGAIVLLVGLAWLLSVSIVHALRGVGATAAAIAAGNLDARTTITGDDELGVLGTALNGMADSLRTLFARLADEAQRDAFSSQLVEAFEVADTEEAAYTQVGRVMRSIDAGLPMELLLADSSQAHLRTAAVHPTAGAPGCGVQTPYACLAVRRGRATTFDTSEAMNACPKLRDRPTGPCSAACVPVTFMGRALGVLHVTGADGAPPPPPQMVRLTALAAQIGTTIGTVRATETTQRQAATDGLTGLVNRRTLENELRLLAERGQQFALVMADLDSFKTLNDTFGHEAGDRALRLFSQVARASVHAGDLIGRYGGEEFVFVFPDQSMTDALETLERLRAGLAAAQTSGGTPPFTSSFGVTDSSLGHNSDEMLRLADDALSLAKGEGRDRVATSMDLALRTFTNAAAAEDTVT